MAGDYRFRGTASFNEGRFPLDQFDANDLFYILLDTFVLQIPFAHLLIIIHFVLLVVRPAHMKDVRLDFSTDYVLHEILSAVVRMATRKVVAVARKDFDSEAVHGSVLLEQGN